MNFDFEIQLDHIKYEMYQEKYYNNHEKHMELYFESIIHIFLRNKKEYDYISFLHDFNGIKHIYFLYFLLYQLEMHPLFFRKK